jgi:hypothetical protein
VDNISLEGFLKTDDTFKEEEEGKASLLLQLESVRDERGLLRGEEGCSDDDIFVASGSIKIKQRNKLVSRLVGGFQSRGREETT